jgi:hypothetical protein
MTRILYWNIQQFGLNKINELVKRPRNSNVRPVTQAATLKLDVIRTTLTQNTPDIFVVVETNTGAGLPGTLVTGKGLEGAQFLLNQMRGWFPLSDWMLVPPMRLGLNGMGEGISVFYNNANVKFSGPWGWLGNDADVVAMGAVNVQNYAPPVDQYLPNENSPNVVGNIYNPGVACRSLAGQWKFDDINGTRLNFPGSNNRTPFLTTFWDVAAGRTIKLLSFHASPKKGPASSGTNNLSKIPEMTNLAANEVGVIVGDFNVNILDAFYEPLAYTNLTGALPIGAGYTREINPTVNQFPEKGYIATMIKPVSAATPWETNGYPGYGYAVTASYVSVDNILTRYGSAAAGGPTNNFTIVNRVTGTPYNLIPPLGPTGALVYNSAMASVGANGTGLPLPPNGPNGVGGTANNNIGALTTFRGWPNYRKIRGTSDHLPLIVDV